MGEGSDGGDRAKKGYQNVLPWLASLAVPPEDGKKALTIIQLNMAGEFQMAFGHDLMGHLVAGDEDGVWDNLREAKMLIHRKVQMFTKYLSGKLHEPLTECFADHIFKEPLMALLASACNQAMGEHAAGKLADLERTTRDVLLMCRELDRVDFASANDFNLKSSVRFKHKSLLTDVFLSFMTTSCAIWTELVFHTMIKAGHGPAMAVVPKVRQSAKFEAASCLFNSLPEKLTKGAGGMLAGLLEDTLEIYDLVVELVFDKEKTDLPVAVALDYAAFTKFYDAAKKLAKTSLADLMEEGLETDLTEEEWTLAAKEGLVICMRGEPLAVTLPRDMFERMLDYVIHVLATLAVLVRSSEEEAPGSRFLGSRHYQRAGGSRKEVEACTLGWIGSSKLNTTVTPWLKERWARVQTDTAFARAEKDEGPGKGQALQLSGSHVAAPPATKVYVATPSATKARGPATAAQDATPIKGKGTWAVKSQVAAVRKAKRGVSLQLSDEQRARVFEILTRHKNRPNRHYCLEWSDPVASASCTKAQGDAGHGSSQEGIAGQDQAVNVAKVESSLTTVPALNT